MFFLLCLKSEKLLRIKLKSKEEKEILYKPGDHIEIYAQNKKEYVDFILQRLDNSANFDDEIRFEVFDDKLSSGFLFNCS